MTLSFITPGQPDIRALTTMGVNVKESENPFGYFGTGFKYAVAILLRNGLTIEVITAEEQFQFAARRVSIRGKEFQVVTMNDRELGFTTELGKNWQLWMVYRELWCNTQDEGGRVEAGRANANSDESVICVTGLEEVHANRHEFILQGKPDFKSAGAEIYFSEEPTSFIFYQGIRIGNYDGHPARYTYNIKAAVALTEDRTCNDMYAVREAIAHTINALPNADRIYRLITAEGFQEREMLWPWITLSPAMEKAIRRAMKRNITGLAPSLRSRWEREAKEEDVETFTLSPAQEKAWEKAKTIADLMGFPSTEWKVIFARRLGVGTLGCAKDGKIYIAEAAFDKGVKYLVGTLVEEVIHLRENLRDGSRGMQNYLLDKFVTAAAENLGEVL